MEKCLKIFVVFLLFWVNLYALPSSHGKAESDQRSCGYEGCPQIQKEMLNVHLVPHTHDDVGWLKTVDQYYFGSQSRYQKANVQSIIDSVIEALLQDPQRKFIYVESAFFSKWWHQQDDELKEKVKMLVNEGRLEFINGAWSMNDEAATHYQSIIDQFTLGLKFLNETFGECGRPRIGWQIDPFGHAREQASLFSQMGYDGVFFARLDYQDKAKRLEEKSMEMVWKTSENLDDSDLLTGVLYSHYSPPQGFCFDILCNDEPINDDKTSFDYNVDDRIKDFVDYVKTQASKYRTNNIMLTMGDDFHFMAAQMWFKNMDKLIKYTNARQSEFNVNVFYSTPSCYVKSLHDSDISWPTKSDDFFPYASDSHAYWTGYYTSRPTSKRFERIGNQFLQICKSLTSSLKTLSAENEENLDRMRRIMGVMQHHDAITGTEKQHVANDYHRELHASIKACEVNTMESLKQLVTNNNSLEFDFKFESCLNLTISSCEVPEKSDKFVVTVYNPLAHETNQYVRFPVGDFKYEVRGAENNLIASQFVPIPETLKALNYRESSSSFELVFQAVDVPALGFKTFYVTRMEDTSGAESPKLITEPEIIGSENFNVKFDSNGLLSEITVDGETQEIRQNFAVYEGANDNTRSSGAYIFRPKPETDEEVLFNVIKSEIFRGELVDEIHQKFNDWISQVVRIYKEDKFVEFEWLVGPIPVTDNIGKEVVSRFYSDIKSNGEFFTDSNGRETLKRTRNFRETWNFETLEPIAGNYYPINTKIAIEDEEHRMAVLTDRAQGGTSLVDGSLELMVHRRLLRDDGFGVGEALNETAYGDGIVARGKHWLVFGKRTKQSPTLIGQERLLQNQVLMSNWLFFDSASTLSLEDWRKKSTTEHSLLGHPLPPNVYLMSFEPWTENSFLIRFEHVLEKNEDLELSYPVTLNLTEIFPGEFEFSEVTLGGNQWIGDKNRLHFKHEGENGVKNSKTLEGRQFLTNLEITLKPMEIRTFIMSPPNENNHGNVPQKTSKVLIALSFGMIMKVLFKV